MSTRKITMSETELTKRIGTQCENEFKRLSNDLFNQITTKYEDMIKEQTKSEIDKVNDAIKAQCPTTGALVFNLDRVETTVPFSEHSVVKIIGYVDGQEDKSLVLNKDYLTEANLSEIVSFILTYKFVKVLVETGKDVEFYDKDAFEKEDKVVKVNKVYSTKFTTLLNTSKISSIYLVNADLK